MMRQVSCGPRPTRGTWPVFPRRTVRLPRAILGRARREPDMPLMNVLITLIVLGVLLWLVNTYIPMDGKIKRILNVVAVIAVILYVLNVFGIMGHLGDIRVAKN
jgi:hypothetical protein